MILVVKSFRLRDGVDETVFAEVDRRLQRDFTSKQPGLLQCTTARTLDGEWLVLHVWHSHEAADAPSGAGAPIVDEWANLIDPSTSSIERFTRFN